MCCVKSLSKVTTLPARPDEETTSCCCTSTHPTLPPLLTSHTNLTSYRHSLRSTRTITPTLLARTLRGYPLRPSSQQQQHPAGSPAKTTHCHHRHSPPPCWRHSLVGARRLQVRRVWVGVLVLSVPQHPVGTAAAAAAAESVGRAQLKSEQHAHAVAPLTCCCC